MGMTTESDLLLLEAGKLLHEASAILRKASESLIPPFPYGGMGKAVTQAYVDTARAVSRLEEASCLIPGGTDSPSPLEEAADRMEDMKAALGKDFLVLRTGRLPEKLSAARLSFFQGAARHVLRRDAEGAAACFSSTGVRMHFFFVYRAGTPYVRDNDNHQIKHVLDAVCAHIGRSDSGHLCPILLQTVLTEEIREGMYVVAVPMETPWMTDGNDFLGLVKKAFDGR